MNSMLNTNMSGFGGDNRLMFRHHCHRDPVWTPLYKETFLSEFATTTDKLILLQNLGILNSSEIESLISNYLNSNKLSFAKQIADLLNGGTGEPSNPTDNPSDNPSGGGNNSGSIDFGDDYDQIDDGLEDF